VLSTTTPIYITGITAGETQEPKTYKITMKNTHKIAYDYAMALKTQREYDNHLDTALRLINPDNQIYGLADAVEGAYTNLVQELLSENLFDWLMWWMYETEYGTKDMEFIINQTSYDPTQMTLYRFLELVDETN
jgi:hypothetical protein